MSARSGIAAGGVLLAVAVLTGCAQDDAPPSRATPSASASASAGVAVQTLLNGLPMRPEQDQRDYDRTAFGYENGFDPDGDGCYTWREVLIRDSLAPVSIGASCRVSGTWRSVYDDRVTTDPRTLSIDHLVPLAEAWRSGASRWDADRLVAYGNDLDFRPALQAVTAQLNEDKGSDDPATWLPPLDRCTYVAQWIEVKARWDLAVDARERAALQQVLDGCDARTVTPPPAPDVGRLSGTS